jgi:hypothetical protein
VRSWGARPSVHAARVRADRTTRTRRVEARIDGG